MRSAQHITRLSAAIDEVLVPVGFSGAQGDPIPGPGRVGALLWCTSAAEVTSRFPALARFLVLEPDDLAPPACIDLVVEMVDDHGTWRVTVLDLEGDDIVDVLEGLGDPAAAKAARSLVGAPVGESAAQLTGLLRRMLELGRSND